MAMEPEPSPRGAKTFAGKRLAVGVVVLLIVAVGLLPSPYAVQQPGPVLNTLGTTEIDGEVRRVIEIDGAPTTESDAVLNMLTVRMIGHPDDPIRMIDVLPNLFRPGVEIVRLDALYPRGQTVEERDEANQMLMENSQVTATVAALRAMGQDVEGTVTVVDVVADGPAAQVLRPGDILLTIDGVPATGSAQVRDLVGNSPAGSPMELRILREGSERTVSVTPSWSERDQRSLIGVTLTAEYDLPIDVDIALERTGGPSAGMVFALAILETLTEEDLIGDLVVSGTGTIDDGGAIGAVGGVPSKLQAAATAGSEVFLVPLANCSDLPDSLPSNLQIVPVEHMSEVLDALALVRDGERVVGPERCEGADFSGQR